MNIYPPTLSASSVLDTLCHLTSTYQHFHIQTDSKATREQGSKAGKAAKAAKAQSSKTARQLIHGSKAAR